MICPNTFESDCNSMMDPSDKRVFRPTKNCRIEKMMSRTVVGVGNLTSAMAWINQFVATRN